MKPGRRKASSQAEVTLLEQPKHIAKKPEKKSPEKTPLAKERRAPARASTKAAAKLQPSPMTQDELTRKGAGAAKRGPAAKSAAPRARADAKDARAKVKGREPAPATARPPGPAPFRIGFLVHDVSRMRRTVFDQAVKPLGLTRSQWWVLANLSRHPQEGVMQTELARHLDVGKVTVGGLIDRLEASGHVERRGDATDRRAKRVFITSRGYEVIHKMTELGEELNTLILGGISPAHVKIAEEVLHQMKDNLRRQLGGDEMDERDLEAEAEA